MKSIKAISFLFLLSNLLMAQSTLCPPRFLTADFYDEEVYLYWEAPDSANFGTVLYNECFLSCSLASAPMNVEHLIDNESGGWFRNSVGDTSTCGSGMNACNDDGGDDTYSAVALWSAADSAIDSRMFTGAIDLSSYASAHLEFYEGYSYPDDQHDSNMVEISADGGATWELLQYSHAVEIGDTVTQRTIDISSYAGQQVHIGYRYIDNIGNGAGWFVDDIRVWGGTGNETNMCGTFQSYEILSGGVSTGILTTDLGYSVTGLTNDVEYCFEVVAVYQEGTSDPCYQACATPMGAFVFESTTINFPELTAGQYMQTETHFFNFDTNNIDFSIIASPVSDLLIYADQLGDDFENDNFSQAVVGQVFNDTTELGTLITGWWGVGDSSTASSAYLTYYHPYVDGNTQVDVGGSFAFLNDDAVGDNFDFNTENAIMYSDMVDVPNLNNGPVYLMVDILFPQPDGPCYVDDLYSEDGHIILTVDDGLTWEVIDSTFSTGWYWASHMYNITDMLEGATSYRIGFMYDDCDGNWGYGIGIDNVHIKQGDDLSWLSISPYKGKSSFYGGYNDTVEVEIGVYSLYDGLEENENTYISYGDGGFTTLTINTGVYMSAHNEVVPGTFALHQNYPNPFNPVTSIGFELPERTDISLVVYDLLGKKVKTLVNQNLGIGSYQIKWNGLSDRGEMLPSGMYFYELNSSDFRSVKKLILVK